MQTSAQAAAKSVPKTELGWGTSRSKGMRWRGEGYLPYPESVKDRKETLQALLKDPRTKLSVTESLRCSSHLLGPFEGLPPCFCIQLN